MTFASTPLGADAFGFAERVQIFFTSNGVFWRRTGDP